jgi:hypothetical protein
MLPIWLTVLVVIFLVIALMPRRIGRHPHLQVLFAVVVVVAFAGIRYHVI